MSLNLQQEKEQLKKKLSTYTADLKPQKDALQEDVKSYRDSLKEKYEGSLQYVSKGKYVALGLGALYVIYKMISWIWEKPIPDQEEDGPKIVVINSKESSIVRKIKEAIASFILSLAKQELERVLKKLKEQRSQEKKQ